MTAKSQHKPAGWSDAGIRAERDRFKAALELIAESDSFAGGTFVKELQHIATNALKGN